MKGRIILMLALATLLTGCGREYDSVRDAAIEMGKAACERAAERGEIDDGDVDLCVDQFVAYICDYGDCSAEPDAPNDAIGECIEALRELSCTSPLTPAECQI